jgi:hypothetical protein
MLVMSGIKKPKLGYVRFGSEAEGQALNSLTAASERKAATQTKLFNFPD